MSNIEAQTDDDGLYPYLYVEKDTRLIYDVKFFEDFVIVRPASPAFYTSIKKMPLIEFGTEFEEFCGDHEQVREFLRGQVAEESVQIH